MSKRNTSNTSTTGKTSQTDQQPWQDPQAAEEAARYASPIPSRVLISQVLGQHEQPLSHAELLTLFNLTSDDDAIALERRLAAMVRDGQLKGMAGDPQRFRPLDATEIKTGPVQANPRGFGFVLLKDEPDVWLGERDMSLVFHGDVVRVVISGSNRRGQPVGRLLEVVDHPSKQLIGRIADDDGQFVLQPPFPNQHQPITLDNEQVQAMGLQVGDSAKIEITHWPTRDEYASGRLLQSLADRADTQLIVPTTLIDLDIPHEFSDAVLTETGRFKEPGARDRNNRQDLRELPLVTIDGEDARDFDDAVMAEKRPGGNYRLLVAIADVSHYVKPGTALDEEAMLRGTSVYFPNQVVPMLPEALSNGLCSLKPEVDRLCMVCDILITRTGQVKSYEFYPAVMHSQARLTYNQVAAFLNGDKAALPEPLLKNKAVIKSVTVLNQLHELMLGKRSERGAMEFETTETYMTFDEQGAITDILPRTRNDAHRLIEECMLLANVCAADYALKHELPVLYRNHEMPELTRVQKVRDYVQTLGYHFPEQPTQSDYQNLITLTRDRPDAASIHTVLLRSMMQAFYGAENLGHYGLAYDAYAHFTSPIRRYPDLLLHRAIKASVTGQRYTLTEDALAQAGEHLSQTERRADEASRSVQSWLKCHYMQQHLGEQFDGIITAVTEFGLFVTLTELFVEGLVHVRALGNVVNDFMEFDLATQSLKGRSSQQRFALGDRVRILVAGVNLDERKVDFEMVSWQQKNAASGKPATRQDRHQQPAQIAASPATALAQSPSPVATETADQADTPAPARPSRSARRRQAAAARREQARVQSAAMPDDQIKPVIAADQAPAAAASDNLETSAAAQPATPSTSNSRSRARRSGHATSTETDANLTLALDKPDAAAANMDAITGAPSVAASALKQDATPAKPRRSRRRGGAASPDTAQPAISAGTAATTEPAATQPGQTPPAPVRKGSSAVADSTDAANREKADSSKSDSASVADQPKTAARTRTRVSTPDADQLNPEAVPASRQTADVDTSTQTGKPARRAKVSKDSHPDQAGKLDKLAETDRSGNADRPDSTGKAPTSGQVSSPDNASADKTPVQMTDFGKPAKVIRAKKPVEPAKPVKPAKAEKPATPAKPVKADKLVKSDKPVKSDKAGKPEKPAKTDKVKVKDKKATGKKATDK